MVNSELDILFNRLRRDERDGMTELYSLTAPHLYGLIFRVLPNERRASDVLRVLFKQIWDLRSSPAYQRSDLLNVLRAQAHRLAIEYKLAEQFALHPNPAASAPRLESRPDIPAKLAAMDAGDLKFLSAAYLDAVPQDDLAKSFGLKNDEVGPRLSALLTELLEDKS